MKFYSKQVSLMILFSGLAVIIMVILLLARSDNSSKQVEMIFCDVGQGDATLVQFGYFQILIDAGPDDSILECLLEYMPIADRTLEIAVLTHADSDHYKGFNAVLSKYLVAEMWLAPFNKDGDDFSDFRSQLLKKIQGGTRLRIVSQGDFFTLSDDLKISVLWPEVPQKIHPETILSDVNLEFSTSEVWSNDLSIALNMYIFDAEILLTGDIEKSTEQALVKDNLINRVQVLKVAHHGSKTSSTKPFLEKAQPEIAAISSGVNNQHGHPAEEVLASLEDLSTTILRTDQLSTFSLLFEKDNGIKILKGK